MSDDVKQIVAEPRTVASLTKLERKWLSRRECAWCEHLLHHDGCSAIWETCSREQADLRRGAALATYKPRPVRTALLSKEGESADANPA